MRNKIQEICFTQDQHNRRQILSPLEIFQDVTRISPSKEKLEEAFLPNSILSAFACVALKITQEKADSENSLNNSSSKFRGRIKEKFIVTHKLPHHHHRLPDQESLRFPSTKMRINLFEKKTFAKQICEKEKKLFPRHVRNMPFAVRHPLRGKKLSRQERKGERKIYGISPLQNFLEGKYNL